MVSGQCFCSIPQQILLIADDWPLIAEMVKDGYPFLLVSLVLAGLAGLAQWWAVWAVFLLLAAFVAFFFRNPKRQIPADPALIVSPADGKVVKVQSGEYPGFGYGRRISIFLSVFDVHVNRLPVEGKIQDIRYYRGRFMAAFQHRASEENERNSLWIRQGDHVFRVTQIAGLIARRIVCWKKPGDLAARGELFGMIRFGSRVDLELPAEVEILVKVGDRVRGGSSAVGRLHFTAEPQRTQAKN